MYYNILAAFLGIFFDTFCERISAISALEDCVSVTMLFNMVAKLKNFNAGRKKEKKCIQLFSVDFTIQIQSLLQC